MKVKVLSLLMVAVLALGLLAGCGSKASDTSDKDTADKEKTDVVTTASLVNEADALVNALSKDGTWIVCTLSDVSTDKELVMEGDFHNKNDAAEDLYRKLGLYAQDADHKVTARYTLTAPKLTIKSPNAKIQGGTFKGDVYVEANGFTVQDATIDGNVYFASQEYKDSFVLPTEEGKVGTVTGTMEVK